MNRFVYEVKASYAFVERNFNLVKRYWGWELVWLTCSVVNSLAITYIGAGMEVISGRRVDTSYLVLYLLVGTLVWHYLSLVFDNVSEMIAWERWEGTIEYTFMAPVSRFTHMVGTTIFSLIYGLLHTVVILAVITPLPSRPRASQSNGELFGAHGWHSLFHRLRYRGCGASFALSRARLSDDPRHSGLGLAHLRRLLPGIGVA